MMCVTRHILSGVFCFCLSSFIALSLSLPNYRMQQFLLLLPGFFFSTALIASSKTKIKLFRFFAEHSTIEYALILLRSFFPSTTVTNLSEPCTLKSDLVPVRDSVKKRKMFVKLLHASCFGLRAQSR